MAIVRWKLGAFLEQIGLSVYRLHAELGGQMSKTGLYKITRGETSGVDFESLADILEALETLTGEHVELHDILSYERKSLDDTRFPEPISKTSLPD